LLNEWIKREREINVLLGLFECEKILTGNFFFAFGQYQLAELIKRRRLKLLIAETNLRRRRFLRCRFLRRLIVLRA
jgi:hypothetical protein